MESAQRCNVARSLTLIVKSVIVHLSSIKFVYYVLCEMQIVCYENVAIVTLAFCGYTGKKTMKSRRESAVSIVYRGATRGGRGSSVRSHF